MGCFFQQHIVIFLAVMVAAVVFIGDHDVFLKITAVELSGNDAQLGVGVTVAEVQQGAVPQQHGFLIFLAGQRVVDVGKLPGAAIAVLPHKQNTAFPDRADGDHLLHAVRDHKFIRISAADVFQCFQHFCLLRVWSDVVLNLGQNAPKFPMSVSFLGFGVRFPHGFAV